MEMKYPRGRHILVNEDGVRMEHCGYVERNCCVCGKKFLCGVNSTSAYCHYPECKGGKDDPRRNEVTAGS